MKGKVVISKDGPYLVSGGLPLAKEFIVADPVEGCPVEWQHGDMYPHQETYALCRCGESKNKPFCDGTHAKISFDGTETAGFERFIDKAGIISGRDIALIDYPELCALARFCHRAGGIWDLVLEVNDSGSRALAEEIAGNCPAGRLVIWDKKAEKPVEPVFHPSIGLVEDLEKGVSGPIWLKGGIPFESADKEKTYEIRNRVTLCRCGLSGNKPFCDGSHINAEFNDGDESLK
ncbi:MAG TPA: CDGSH iron-sulfur domain-containing protein [Methanocella sp.]|nr:CDGSH iron-sulfur domain-containing protein [Methanocella sp.]